MAKNVNGLHSVIFDTDMVQVTLSKHKTSHKTQMREPILPQPMLKPFCEETGAHHWYWKAAKFLKQKNRRGA